jgi:hypothetical protein
VLSENITDFLCDRQPLTTEARHIQHQHIFRGHHDDRGVIGKPFDCEDIMRQNMCSQHDCLNIRTTRRHRRSCGGVVCAGDGGGDQSQDLYGVAPSSDDHWVDGGSVGVEEALDVAGGRSELWVEAGGHPGPV